MNTIELNATQRIQLKEIRFGFSESPDVQEGKTFDNWDEAEIYLSRIHRQTIKLRDDGEMLGYFKTDIVITWEDGFTWQTRYDIGADAPTIREHIQGFLNVYSGRVKPTHWNDGQWSNFKAEFSNPQEFGRILDLYQF